MLILGQPATPAKAREAQIVSVKALDRCGFCAARASDPKWDPIWKIRCSNKRQGDGTVQPERLTLPAVARSTGRHALVWWI
ncbi:MAG: hypothetical protein E5W83_01120 [Mesorhizobium sp.]|nr:MAG: hypothetical protein E5W83_01120 [Mesorhizobium sp.]